MCEEGEEREREIVGGDEGGEVVVCGVGMEVEDGEDGSGTDVDTLVLECV